MRKRHREPGSVAGERLFQESHLTDEALLLSLDGELVARQAADVDTHIKSCWSCRGRRQAIAQSISDLVEYQNAATTPYLPPPSDQRAIFLARLDELAKEMGRPSRLNRLRKGIVQFLRLGRMSLQARIACALALMIAVPVSYFLRTPPVVSADELLSLSAASEARSLNVATQPVVIQKLRVSVGKRSLTRTMYRDVVHNRTSSRTGTSEMGETQARAAYLNSSLDWNSMLDTATFVRWRASHQQSGNRVVRLKGDLLRLETRSPEGPVFEADLTVRGTDYHAIAESFHFQDESEIQIAELSYNVVPLAAVPVGIFGLPTEPAVIRLPAAAALRAVLPSAVELAEAEVAAESALHQLNADLGEQINITTHAGHNVIEGVVNDDARKQQLISALQVIPHTRLHIVTIDEAAQRPESSGVATHNPPTTSSAKAIVAIPPLLETELNARFPDKDQRIAYVNQTLSLVQLASARAWALKRLADNHSHQETAALHDDARRQLCALLSDHVSALREDISSLQNQLGEILSGSSNTPAANTSLTAPMEIGSTAAQLPEDWREQVRRIHSSTEAVHEAVAALLTSAQPSDQNDAEAIEVNLRTSLTQLQTELQILDQQVRKANLK